MEPTAIVDVTVRDLDLALREPFGIATGVQAAVENLLVRVQLASGAVGWGEAAPFEAVNGETRAVARGAVAQLVAPLRGWDARAWRELSPWLRAHAPRSASARCAVETAVLDALGRHYALPLWVLFGGACAELETDMTITTGTAADAALAAARIARDGFRTIKLKVGGVPLAQDLERVRGVVARAPGCALLLDANGGMGSADEALALLAGAHEAGGRVVLFEQPMPGEDLEGMAAVAAATTVPIAADESVACTADVLRVADARAADAVNLKIMKSGVVEALEMAAAARARGLGLMVGGMVETDVAMTTSACLAAGQGGFAHVDLDTPMFLADRPFALEHLAQGPRIDLRGIRGGHGVVPRLDDRAH